MDENKRSGTVDAETMLAIQEENAKVIKSFQESLEKFGKDIKEWILLQFHPMKDDVARLRTDVADLYEKDRSMRDRVSVLEQRQATDEGQRTGAGTAEEGFNRRREVTAGMLTLLISGVAALSGCVGWLISFLG